MRTERFSRVSENCSIQPLPDLPAEGADLRDEDDAMGNETADGEEPQPAGLHAKLLFAEKARAGSFGWEVRTLRNAVGTAATLKSWASSRSLAAYLTRSKSSSPTASNSSRQPPLPRLILTRKALESARKALSGKWPLRQRIGDSECEIIAREPPPIGVPGIELEVAVLGGSWGRFGRKRPIEFGSQVCTAGSGRTSSSFVSRPMSGHALGCNSPPVNRRPTKKEIMRSSRNTSILGHSFSGCEACSPTKPASVGGGDWDVETPPSIRSPSSSPSFLEAGIGPSVEEILRSWSRDPSSFAAADDKVKAYLGASLNVGPMNAVRQAMPKY